MILSTKHATLITSSQYADEIIHVLRSARRRIAIVTTTIRDDDPRTHTIIEEIIAASTRGVMVTVCADIFTYIEPKEFILRSPKRQPARAYRALQLERKLKKHGVTFRWLGRTSNITLSGRTHSKWLVIDDTVYSFGGINLDCESLDNTDYMLKLHSSTVADQIFNEHSRLLGADRGAHASRSHHFRIDNASQVLIDGGLFGDSLIYRRAVTLAREAERIVIVSQYCPTGKLNRILRRKDASIYFNHWRQAAWVNKALIGVGVFFAKQHTLYEREPYLHAKFMIGTMPDGSKRAITGSHNFMFGSGLMGTREIALETTDTKIIRQLERFIDTYVA